MRFSATSTIKDACYFVNYKYLVKALVIFIKCDVNFLILPYFNGKTKFVYYLFDINGLKAHNSKQT